MTRSNGIDLEKSKTNKKAKTNDDDCDDLYQTFRARQHLFTNNPKYEPVLKLHIHHAEGLENPATRPPLTYSVESWIEPDQGRARTNKVFGLPNPVWDREFYLRLNRFWDLKFLHIEVLRHGSWSEPGTSSGFACVGRVRIPLPEELHASKSGRFGLVRLVGGEVRGEGHIIVSMKLMKFRRTRV
ncbi:hypothetical protein HS088_TW21G01529 [Tripterygium wilfordii]|uniref:C2 domain-containing protein n=1 Tax=Tripterygium wilfordii TaxID=458696 RepID=A0A7J7C5G2_TRIWF|nr:hypothetical protein HS088_TW21G01529 [Tripterygium wilfordii]